MESGHRADAATVGWSIHKNTHWNFREVYECEEIKPGYLDILPELI